MAYDFLPQKPKNEGKPKPDKKPQNESKPKPGSGGEKGSSFKEGKTIFIDTYSSHLDSHNAITVPVNEKDFKLKHNYIFASNQFSNEKTTKQIDSGWYGENTELERLKEGYTQFSDPELLTKAISFLKESISEDMFSGIEKPKMKINDRFGMFSFDLAAMSMFYVYEYFTKSGKKVDANFVTKKGDLFIDITTGEFVNQKIKKRANGTPYVVSNNKNCLIDFEKKKSQERAVEIFINNSFTWREKASEIVYNSLAGISVAENLIKKGFKVKLTALFIGEHHEGLRIYHFVPVKNFNQPLDINAAAYVCGDARFFRYQYFKMMIKAYDDYNIKSIEGIAYAFTDNNQIALDIEEKYVPNSQKTQADTRLYFGGSRNMNAVKKEVDKAIKILIENYGKENKN